MTDLLPIGDMTPRLVTTLQGNPGRVMQSFVRAPWSGEYFEAQVESGDGATSDLRISRCDSTGKRLDYAILDGAGHGSSITAEYSDGKVWIWLFWGADVNSAQGAAVRWAYSGTTSGARVLQADTEPVADPGIGATGHTYGKFAIDQASDRVATAFRSGSTETFALYKLSDYKAAGPEGTPPAALKTATVTWPAGSSFQGFTITDTRAYISRGGSAPGDVEPTLYELDWATGAIVGTKDISGLAAVAGDYASGGHNEAEGVCLYRDQAGNPELLFGIVTGPIYTRQARVYSMKPPVDGTSSKTLLLDVEQVTGEAMTNAVVYVSYDRTVRHTDGGMTPKTAVEKTLIANDDRVQVFASDHPSLTDDSYGFVMHVSISWDNPANPGERRTATYTAQVSAASPDVVALSQVLVADGFAAPGQIVASPGPAGKDGADGQDGHSPVVGMSGDQVTVDGTITGPHLTGPQGATGNPTAYELRGTGSPVGVVTPAAKGIYYTDTAGTNGAWRWISAGTTNTSWIVTTGDTTKRTLTVQTGSASAASVQRSGTWVEVTIVAWTSATSNTAAVVIGPLPAGFGPSNTTVLWGADDSGRAVPFTASFDRSKITVANTNPGAKISLRAGWTTIEQWPTALP